MFTLSVSIQIKQLHKVAQLGGKCWPSITIFE